MPTLASTSRRAEVSAGAHEMLWPSVCWRETHSPFTLLDERGQLSTSARGEGASPPPRSACTNELGHSSPSPAWSEKALAWRGVGHDAPRGRRRSGAPFVLRRIRGRSPEREAAPRVCPIPSGSAAWVVGSQNSSATSDRLIVSDEAAHQDASRQRYRW